MTEHRLFSEPCDLPTAEHVVGDRHVEAGRVVDELTKAGTWTSVGPVDDVAMTARDDQGWLACPVCRRTHAELVEAGG